jgi:hypothetical protein
MRATGLMPSSEATSLVRRSAKTATPQGAKDQVALQGAMLASPAKAQDRSTSLQPAQLGQEDRLD